MADNIGIDTSTIKRDKDAILKHLKQTDSSIIALKPLKIVSYYKFVERDITVLGNTTYVCGISAIYDPDTNRYATLLIPNRIQTQPADIETIIIDDAEYIVLSYYENSEIISSLKLVKESDYVFDIFELLLIDGKVPFYINYEDLIEIFGNLKYYNGFKANDNPLAYEVLATLSARTVEDPYLPYRLGIDENKKIKWVGLDNIWYSFGSTIAKISGGYMKSGIVSAMLDKEKSVSLLENVVRE